MIQINLTNGESKILLIRIITPLVRIKPAKSIFFFAYLHAFFNPNSKGNTWKSSPYEVNILEQVMDQTYINFLRNFQGNPLTTIYMIHDELMVSIPIKICDTTHFIQAMTYHENEPNSNMHV